MTNEQLTQEIMNLKEHQAKSIAEHEKFEMILAELQEDVKATKTLAEDVHIMAINMQNMQKTMEDNNQKLEETNRKVDAISSKEFVEYKENKKLIKQNIISKVITTLITIVLTGIAFLFGLYFKGGM